MVLNKNKEELHKNTLTGCCAGLYDLNKNDHIKKFWVGLLEKDGSIIVRRNRNNKVYGCFAISLKYLQTNKHMLEIISEVIGGRIYYEKQPKKTAKSLKNVIIKVIWVAVSKKDFNNCYAILQKYPLLISKKICQLQHLEQCLAHQDWDYHLKTRSQKFITQKNKIDYYNKFFVLPDYFDSWLSGFIEAEGCFRYLKKPSRAASLRSVKESLYISQNSDYYILNAIKQFFNENHKIGIHKDARHITIHYRISFSGKPFIKKILDHLTKYPLLGEKKRLFVLWKKAPISSRSLY